MKQKLIFPSSHSALVSLNRWLKQPAQSSRRIFILVDEQTGQHCLPSFVASVPALVGAEFFEVPSGEEAKDIAIASQLWQSLLESGADRSSLLINLGGGCVSDLGGFVASTFMRGIGYVNVPTSLIAMADAAIGGKTALNLNGVKNMAGTFCLPQGIYFHPEFLGSLPDREWESGLFEVAKTLLLSDGDMLSDLESAVCVGTPLRDLPMDRWIRQCAEFKAAVVAADPNERSVRRILNLGHTFGHAVESFSLARNGNLSHGFAVGIGLWCALYLSVKKLGLNPSLLDKYGSLLHSLVEVPHFSLRDTEELLSFMRQDKKNRDGSILCVLLQDIGLPVIDVCVSEPEIRDAFLQVGK